jgi:hypothetical protein
VATNLGGWTDKELEQFESKDPNISAWYPRTRVVVSRR